MKVINIVDNIDPVNFGIWNAVVSTSGVLKAYYGVTSYLVHPEDDTAGKDFFDCISIPVQNILKMKDNAAFLEVLGTPEETIVVTHGTWQYPTRWGRELKKRGYPWIYVPHGMLEPWQMQQKRLKKLIYFNLIEHPFTRKADIVRAVGSPELNNLKKYYTKEQLRLIPNGVPKVEEDIEKDMAVKTFVFMGRLHHKKGVVPLVKAWKNSGLYGHAEYQLLIAGPDHGELEKITALLGGAHQQANVHYIGPQYGEDKNNLLRKATFFILPSQSEGFPTSILEAMQYGAIPIITDGCNFPELEKEPFAYTTTTQPKQITKTLDKLHKDNDDLQLKEFSQKNKNFAGDYYSIEHIANLQYANYEQLLKA